MTILKLCMVALLILASSTVIRAWKSDFLPLIRIGAVVLFGTLLIASATPLLSLITTLGNGAGVSKHIETILKGLGIVILTQICSDICRDSGESTLAGHIETVGKLELLLLCIPLIEEILATAEKLLEMGGQG
jgi:stage III sporulation protein AD